MAMTYQITIQTTPDIEEKLKKLLVFNNAGQHPAFQINTNEELIKLLIDKAYREMKVHPIGRQLFW